MCSDIYIIAEVIQYNFHNFHNDIINTKMNLFAEMPFYSIGNTKMTPGIWHFAWYTSVFIAYHFSYIVFLLVKVSVRYKTRNLFRLDCQKKNKKPQALYLRHLQ